MGTSLDLDARMRDLRGSRKLGETIHSLWLGRVLGPDCTIRSFIRCTHGQILRDPDRARHGPAEYRGHGDADFIGHAGTPGRGAFLVLFLKIQDYRIAMAKYQTYGCGPTIAAGSMLTELIVGRTIDECRTLTTDDLIAALDGVPPDKLHCPVPAIGALQDALRKGTSY